MTPPQSQKAKSRLQPATPPVQASSSIPNSTVARATQQPQRALNRPKLGKQVSTITLQSFFKKRTRTTPLLVLSLLSFSSVIYILTTITPQSIANILFYQSYLPLTTLFTLATITMGIYVCNHTRRGLLLGLFLSLMLFFKLQDVALTPSTIFIPAVVALSVELIFSFIFKK